MNVETTKRRERKSTLTAAAVEKFLRQHPDFFQERLDLLESLKVPHPCGEAVSLITRQIELLREKNRRLQVQMNDILHIARDNDALHHRIHQLTLALLDAAGLEDALAGLKWGLHQYFQADFVAVRIVQPCIESPVADLCMAPGGVGPVLFESVLESGKPQCGQADAAQAEFLFGDEASEVASCALIPLQHAGLRGVLAIGSRNPTRFQAGMGFLFLTQMGEIVSARLAALLNGPA
jgi:uncharacterized protein YigA (DUF484 family)